MAKASEEERSRMSRNILRQATFVDPRTAMKSKRRITLRAFADADGDDAASQQEDNDTTPLLPGRNANASDKKKSWVSRKFDSTKQKLKTVRTFVASELGTDMLKFALAYLLGSMGTFIPALSALFGRRDYSKHLIATVTVYFHPARPLGSMLDALMLATTAFVYTAVISLVSMSVSVLFADVFHLIVVGHAIVLIVFVGGGFGFVGWIKQNQGGPLISVACSLTSLSLSTILTREGAVQDGDYSFYAMLQTLKMIVAGVLSSMIVSFTVFPTLATLKLREAMVTTTDSLSDMLGMITASFISGNEEDLEAETFTNIDGRQKKSLASLPQKARESRYEHCLLGTEKDADLESKLVSCLQRIAQSIGGLRASAAMQFVIINQPAPLSTIHNSERLSSRVSLSSSHVHFGTGQERHPIGLNGLVRSMVSSTDDDGFSCGRSGMSQWKSPQEIFELFIDQLGPSMRSLAWTMKEILDDLPFDPGDKYKISSNPRFIESLEEALALYKQARQEALKTVYDEKDLNSSRPMEVEADWEEAAACCGHFSFSLLEVADTIKEFLLCLDELELQVTERPSGRTWGWLKFWKHLRPRRNAGDITAMEENNINDDNFAIPEPKNRNYDRIPQDTRHKTWKQPIFRKLHQWLSVFRREDTKYAIKVGFGAMLYALPSYIPETRKIYAHWRGEWGLLSYMLVCSMTIGASNTTGYQRFLGTLLGATLAVTAWEISHDNPYVLAFFGFCMAYWTSYIIIGKGKGPLGRFIMLSYNLSALYAYSLTMADDDRNNDEEDNSNNPRIFAIALHRVVAVLSGCVWGLIITRAVWPISARQKLKHGLSLLWLRMGLIWKRDPLSVFVDGEHDHHHRYMNQQEEMELQRFLAKLRGLVAASQNEFELRRPFPEKAYTKILQSTGRMLEAFHEMNLVIMKDLTASPGELELLRATAEERRKLCSRISHLFTVLASSMRLEYSIATDALPRVETTRDRLLARIFGYRRSDGFDRITTDEDYGLFYTYALFTGQIGMEIQSTLKEIEGLFGVLGEEILRLQ